MTSLGKRTVLVTGGTGSFGQFIVCRLLNLDVKEIRVLSRDEKKHYDMRMHYGNESRLRLITGDIRDRDRVREAMVGCDVVFQAAALKHVYNCEVHPYEAVRTNIIGMQNVVSVALELGVERMVSVSTDKAVKPVNVMGMTKAIQERLAISANLAPGNRGTKSTCVRYGNVMSSRGSAIPFFRQLADAGKPITITHPEMTRFLLTLNDAIDLVLHAVENMNGGEIYVKKAPSVQIVALAKAICEERGVAYHQTIIGMLPGEKLHEILISEEEMSRTHDCGSYYCIDPHWTGAKLDELDSEYSSVSNVMHCREEITALLKKSDAEIQAFGIHDGVFLK